MAIGPLEMNGMLSRTQDITTIKHNEDNKGMVDQGNFQTQFKQEVDHHMNRVNKGEDAKQGQTRYDAKEKGNNQYTGDGGKNKKKQEQKSEGKVVVKGNHSFDIKI